MPPRRLPPARGAAPADAEAADATAAARAREPRSTLGSPSGGERLASMGLVVDLPSDVPPPPALKDVSWVLADLATGEVVAAKAAHARLLPASTLKTLTALTLIPAVDRRTAYRRHGRRRERRRHPRGDASRPDLHGQAALRGAAHGVGQRRGIRPRPSRRRRDARRSPR